MKNTLLCCLVSLIAISLFYIKIRIVRIDAVLKTFPSEIVYDSLIINEDARPYIDKISFENRCRTYFIDNLGTRRNDTKITLYYYDYNGNVVISDTPYEVQIKLSKPLIVGFVYVNSINFKIKENIPNE